jgi:hypothetical protein
MARYIEWRNEEENESERAEITKVVAKDGKYFILFSNTELMSDGRLELDWGDGVQFVDGEYGYTDGSYKGTAKVMGNVIHSRNTLEFTGTWHDPDDGTGQWDLYLYIDDVPGQEFTFRYDDLPAA